MRGRQRRLEDERDARGAVARVERGGIDALITALEAVHAGEVVISYEATRMLAGKRG